MGPEHRLEARKGALETTPEAKELRKAIVLREEERVPRCVVYIIDEDLGDVDVETRPVELRRKILQR